MPSDTQKQDPGEITIVVVDDDPDVGDFFEAALSREGFKVFVFRTGDDALKVLKSKNYQVNLILLDLMMPGTGGYAILKDLQQTDYMDVPVFVITARNLDKTTKDTILMESNVRELIIKPVNPLELVEKIHRTLGTTSTRKKSYNWTDK